MTAMRGGLVVAVVFLAAGLADAREWKDRSGSYRVDAELVSVADGKVKLQRTDGTIVDVPLTRLCEADLEYLQSLPEYKAYFREHPVEAPSGSEGEAGSGSTAGSEAQPAGSGGSRPPLATIHVDDENHIGEVRRFGDMGWGVKSLAFSPDGAVLAFGKMDRAFGLLDVDKTKPIAMLTDQEALGEVTALAFSPDGTKLLTGGYRGRISVWTPKRRGFLEETARFVGHNGEVAAIAVSADGQSVLSAGKDKRACYWDLATGREKFAVTGFERDVQAVHLTPSGRQGLATDGQTVALIDVPRGIVIQTMKLPGYSRVFEFSPDGTLLAAVDTYAVRLWDVTTGQELSKMQDNETQWELTFLPGGKHLLSGGRGKVNVWDLASGRKLYEFDTAGTYYVQCIAASPDNRHFAAIPGSAGQALQVFRLPADLK